MLLAVPSTKFIFQILIWCRNSMLKLNFRIAFRVDGDVTHPPLEGAEQPKLSNPRVAFEKRIWGWGYGLCLINLPLAWVIRIRNWPFWTDGCKDLPAPLPPSSLPPSGGGGKRRGLRGQLSGRKKREKSLMKAIFLFYRFFNNWLRQRLKLPPFSNDSPNNLPTLNRTEMHLTKFRFDWTQLNWNLTRLWFDSIKLDLTRLWFDSIKLDWTRHWFDCLIRVNWF